MSSPAPSVREAHEDFVSGHGGSSAFELIRAISAVFPALVVSAIVVQGRMGWRWFLAESVIVVLPLVLSVTALADYTLELWLAFTALAAASLFLASSLRIPFCRSGYVDNKRLGCLTSARAMLNLVTSVAILAVDFHSFPRRFAKTEEYGYSLMDLGAIGFVIVNGFVESRRRTNKWSVLRDGVILTLLGIGRLWLVGLADYQHHVTEYGRHANFFFTLAFVKLTCSWWAWRLQSLGAVVLAMCVLACHQLSLTLGGGADWVLGPAPRDTLLSANREWVVSLPGYLCSYFLGVSVGSYLFTSSRANLTHSIMWIAVRLFVCVLALHHYVSLPSRRVANPTFVVFAVFFATLTLTHCLVVEALVSSTLPGLPTVPIIFHAINRRPLLCFLLANVSTGAINMSINTLDVAYPWDVCVVAVYTLGILSVLYYLFICDSERKQKVR